MLYLSTKVPEVPNLERPRTSIEVHGLGQRCLVEEKRRRLEEDIEARKRPKEVETLRKRRRRRMYRTRGLAG